MKRGELIITNSKIPVIRAGYANIMLLFLPIGLILLNQLLKDFGAITSIKWIMFFGVCVLFIKIYACSISRLFIDSDNKLVLVGPFWENKIEIVDITKINIYGIPSSMFIFIKINKAGIGFPLFYFFVAVSTNLGSYIETKSRLASLFRDLGCKNNCS